MNRQEILRFLGVVVIVSHPLSACKHAEPLLELAETSAQVLPDTFQIVGVSASASGRAVIWAGNQSYLMLLDSSGTRLISSEGLRRPVAAALTEDDQYIEVIDASRKVRLRLDLTGRVIEEQALMLPWTVASAVRVSQGWILGGHDVAGNYRVVVLSQSGERKRLLTVGAKSHQGRQLTINLSGSGKGLFATWLMAPYTVQRLAPRIPADQAPATEAFAAPRLRREIGSGAPLWVSMSLHALDNGYIRTFSDVRSDRRLLAVYDDSGRLLRELPISVPIGVLATAPHHQMLFAARRTDRLELVTYRWRWVGVDP